MHQGASYLSFAVAEDGRKLDIATLTSIPACQSRLFEAELLSLTADIQRETQKNNDDTRVLRQCLDAIYNATAKRTPRTRKEARSVDLRNYKWELLQSNVAECQSRIDNKVYELADTRKSHATNCATGKLVLTHQT